jgi:hypothetical protein
MRARDLVPKIRRAISYGESAEDVVFMIDTLARLRAEKRSTSGEEETGPAATLLCILFDIFKTQAHRAYAAKLRRNFAGIALDPAIRSRFAAALPDVFLTDEPSAIFGNYGSYAGEPAPETRSGAGLVTAVADMYALDVDKVRRMFDATARVLQLRFRIARLDSYEVMNRVFRVALRETARINNPYGWILNAAIHLGSGWSARPETRPQSLEDLLRPADDDEESRPDVSLEE